MKTLQEELVIDETTPLNFNDLHTILAHRVSGLHVNFIDLEDYGNSAYELRKFMPSGSNSCLLLLSASVDGRTQRHWTCMIRHADSKLSFYDSLAFGIDKISSMLHDNGKFAQFIRKIRAEPNRAKHQSSSRGITTCGLHCVTRLVQYKKKNNEYDHWLKSVNMKFDELVALITYIGHLSVTK